MPPKSIEILLVEDNPADVAFTRQALADAKVLNRLHVVEDGATALDFLRRRGEHASAPRPDLVLLDLNLPGIDGREVLEAIKGDPGLMDIPVIVLTNSAMKEDVQRAYRRHASCYIVKPVDRQQFLTTCQALKRFWLQVVALPRGGKGGL